MKIPKQIKIGAISVEVKKVTARDVDNQGDYNNYHKIIKIRDDDTKEADMAETFLHEILEAIDKLYNLQINHTTLTVLSMGLFSVIRDNRVDFLGEDSGIPLRTKIMEAF